MLMDSIQWYDGPVLIAFDPCRHKKPCKNPSKGTQAEAPMNHQFTYLAVHLCDGLSFTCCFVRGYQRKYPYAQC